MAERIKLSRAKGWRMPPNTVKVDRSTKWGNPFIVGKDGNTGDCVYLYMMLGAGYLVLSSDSDCVERQGVCRQTLDDEKANRWSTLKGKNLACWCRLDKPCHADLLINMANGIEFDPGEYFQRFGFQIPREPRASSGQEQ